jgi:hypothetical protein
MVMGAAAKLVPAEHAAAWSEEWLGSLWRWTLEAAAAGQTDSASALVAHTRSAAREAFLLRFRDEATIESWRRFRGRPSTCLAFCAALAITFAAGTGGFGAARRLEQGWLHGLPYRDAGRLVVLTQGSAALGLRLGFRSLDVDLFRERSHSLDGVATYVWYGTWLTNKSTNKETGKRERDLAAANVSPDFFRVLGVTPLIGRGLDEVSVEDGAEPFVASYQFWERNLVPRGGRVGQRFEIGGRSMWLAGVLPLEFWFLAPETSLWTARQTDPPTSPNFGRWVGLKGTVARLRAGVTPDSARAELRQVLVNQGVARRGYQVYASGVVALVFQGASAYGMAFLAAMAAVLACAFTGMYRGRRRGSRWSLTLRYWGFFVLKCAVPLSAIFLWVLEGEGVSTFAITGRAWWGRELFSQWAGLCGAVMILLWAWRDQRSRCRVCLERMRQPVRIGVPGRMLLDTAGLEVMCPRGHGAVYTSESVLGSDLSDRWMGFEDELTRMGGEP